MPPKGKTKTEPAEKPADEPKEEPTLPEDKPDGEPPADEPGEDTPADEDTDSGEGTPSEDEPQMGLVTEPCRVCWPDGWPAAEEGAWVNCVHNHGIRYGEQVEITRARALELGFLTSED